MWNSPLLGKVFWSCLSVNLLLHRLKTLHLLTVQKVGRGRQRERLCRNCEGCRGGRGSLRFEAMREAMGEAMSEAEVDEV